MEKCIGWVLLYPFLGDFVLIKSAKRMCIYDYVKNRIGTFQNLCFDVEKGYKRINVLNSPKTYCCAGNVFCSNSEDFAEELHFKLNFRFQDIARVFPCFKNTFNAFHQLAGFKKQKQLSNCPEVFCKRGVLKNFAKLVGKNLSQSLFFSKVAGFRPVTLLKKRLWHKHFLVNFAEVLRTPFLIERLWLLLLKKQPKVGLLKK